MNHWVFIQHNDQGRARTQSPTTRNCAVEIPTFGEFAGVSTTGVQWPSLALGEPPSWSWYLPCQVSMSWKRQRQWRHSQTQHSSWRSTDGIIPEFSVFSISFPCQAVSPSEKANTALRPSKSLKSKHADNGRIFGTPFFHKVGKMSVRRIQWTLLLSLKCGNALFQIWVWPLSNVAMGVACFLAHGTSTEAYREIFDWDDNIICCSWQAGSTYFGFSS